MNFLSTSDGLRFPCSSPAPSDDQLCAFAGALAINEAVLELEIARFQRQMAH